MITINSLMAVANIMDNCIIVATVASSSASADADAAVASAAVAVAASSVATTASEMVASHWFFIDL